MLIMVNFSIQEVTVLLSFVGHEPKSVLGHLVFRFLDHTQLDTHSE
jgi:azurin